MHDVRDCHKTKPNRPVIRLRSVQTAMMPGEKREPIILLKEARRRRAPRHERVRISARTGSGARSRPQGESLRRAQSSPGSGSARGRSYCLVCFRQAGSASRLRSAPATTQAVSSRCLPHRRISRGLSKNLGDPFSVSLDRKQQAGALGIDKCLPRAVVMTCMPRRRYSSVDNPAASTRESRQPK
jgi:hypothetical protein